MKLIVHIESDNAAFDNPDGCAELKRILSDLASRLYFEPNDEDYHCETMLCDINGNKVGYAIISNL